MGRLATLTAFLAVIVTQCAARDRTGNGHAPLAAPLEGAEVSRVWNAKQVFVANLTEADAIKIGRQIAQPVEENLVNSLRALKVLPEISAAINADDETFVRATEVSFRQDAKELSLYSVGEMLMMFLVATVHTSVYHYGYLHRYDHYQDMKLAAGPEVGHERCLRQLKNMNERAVKYEEEGFNSTDINLLQTFSTWARAPNDFMLGHLFVEGDYERCGQSKLYIEEEREFVPMRYCVLSLRSRDWPQVDKHDLIDLKAGVCLPKACDSADYKDKFQLVEALALNQLKPMPVDQLRVGSLYCLPDEDSPLRSVRHSPAARAAAACLLVWISILVFATHKYKKIQQQQLAVAKWKSIGGQSIHDEASLMQHSEGSIEIYRMLSVTNNLKLLFDTTKESSLIESSAKATSHIKKQEPEVTSDSTSGAAQNDGPEDSGGKIDLRSIEGIKVIAMCYVIMGHVVMCLPTIVNNGRDFAEQGVDSLAFFIANLVPAFAVNTFFCITGILTCYLMFKQNKSQQVITSPAKWAALIVYRYLRIMPMYALAVLYCKTLAKFAGSGPLWDYGTSSLSQRRICEDEPWRWTLTFTSNFLPPMRHCIPGGWYLSNDMQFLLVTPVFLVALHLRPRLGKALLYAGIAAGYLAGFLSIYTSAVSDLRPIAQFMPYGFKTYVSHLSFNYTHPQYRIPAYLVGLLVGFRLFRWGEEQAGHARLAEAERRLRPAPTWSGNFKSYGAYLTTFLVAGSCVTPIIGRMLPFNKAAAKAMVAFVTPSYHVIFASAVGMFLMLATTGHANKHLTRFLSSPRWKPFARLSLCAVLVNVEVINYIIQSNTRQQEITNSYLMVLNVTCIVSTYAVSTLVCVLFEAPVRSGLNSILAGLMKSMARKQKAKLS